MENHADILIVGGGVVGLTLALSLLKYTTFSIALLEERALNHPIHHDRVSAINLASERIFRALAVWDDIKPDASPFTGMCVWDNPHAAGLVFKSVDIEAPQLGHIIANDVMLYALFNKAQTYHRFHFYPQTVFDGQKFQATLMVAADGAASTLRKQAGILVHEHPYQQAAIVATIQSAIPHEKIARQIFLKTGPLAFLPLQEPHMTSIVWSLPQATAKEMLALDDERFLSALSLAFDPLGAFISTTKRMMFPLKKQQAYQYIADRVALIGDAAHTMHPLAGQGLNSGLLDAASLFDIIIAADKNHEDIGSHAVLRRYERWRRADNQLMLAGVHQLKQLFAKENKGFVQLRRFGLQLVNQLPWLKNEWMRYATGEKRLHLPTLAHPCVLQ